MARDNYKDELDYTEDGDGASGGDDQSASLREDNAQVQDNPPKITSDSAVQASSKKVFLFVQVALGIALQAASLSTVVSKLIHIEILHLSPMR